MVVLLQEKAMSESSIDWTAIVAIFITVGIVVLILFFGGEPDLQDAIIESMKCGNE
jgi:hypothetical protein